jgi:hypothetical protein
MIVYSENHTKTVKTPCQQYGEIINVKTGGKYTHR